MGIWVLLMLKLILLASAIEVAVAGQISKKDVLAEINYFSKLPSDLQLFSKTNRNAKYSIFQVKRIAYNAKEQKLLKDISINFKNKKSYQEWLFHHFERKFQDTLKCMFTPKWVHTEITRKNYAILAAEIAKCVKVLILTRSKWSDGKRFVMQLRVPGIWQVEKNRTVAGSAVLHVLNESRKRLLDGMKISPPRNMEKKKKLLESRYLLINSCFTKELGRAWQTKILPEKLYLSAYDSIVSKCSGGL